MRDYLLKIMQFLLLLKKIGIVFWTILFIGSIGLLMFCVVVGNSQQFHSVINYLVAAGIIGLLMSIGMTCWCSCICDQLECNRELEFPFLRRNNSQPIIQSRYREAYSINEPIISDVAVATYIQNSDPVGPDADTNDLPVAKNISQV